MRNVNKYICQEAVGYTINIRVSWQQRLKQEIKISIIILTVGSLKERHIERNESQLR